MIPSFLVKYDSITGNVIPEISIPEALVYALVGFCITFLGIVILIFFVWACGKIIKSVLKKAKENAKSKDTAAIVPEEVQTADGISESVKVAIIAAIAAYYAGENSTCEFKVKRIKRL